MNQSEIDKFLEQCAQGDPEAALERMLLEEFLRTKGYSLKELEKLPEDQAKVLMTEACEYASLRLAQVESTAHFREKIRGPSLPL